jgi:hypothetical protein
MKTFDKVFSIIFMALAVMTFVTGLFNAPHQFVLASLCALAALIMYPEKSDNEPC